MEPLRAILRSTALALFLPLPLGCGGSALQQPAPAPPAVGRTAILVSIDALAEGRLKETLPASAIPALLDIFDSAACASGAIPAFPSLTAAGHAALWTGAFGDVNGIAANLQPRLPIDRHNLLDLGSGYFADALSAEPIWITAAREGVRVVGHHVTQAPHPPGYPALYSGAADPSREAVRREAEEVLQRENVFVLNGYNRLLARDAVITQEVTAPRTETRWSGFATPDGSLPPLEISWEVGGTRLYGLILGESSYDRVLISPARDTGSGVVARAVPPDTSAPGGRPLARHFTEPLALTVGGERVALHFRLFHLAPDATTFLLYHTAAHRMDASNSDRGAAYIGAVGGWSGNAALGLLRRGAFGSTIASGGDGSAEWLYLETAEHMTRSFMRGSEWLFDEMRPALLLDYFPLGDELDHEYLALIDPTVPGYDPAVAALAQRVRARGWRLVDLRVEHLRKLALRGEGGALFVTGDHGMRSAWRIFRPNAALREAGLLTVLSDSAIHLPGTQAVAPNGYWINVNREARLGGVVPPEREDSVLLAAEAALLSVRDEEGEAVVTGVWRPADRADLGLGGPAGGDLYFELASGYHPSAEATGPLVGPARAEGKHGLSSLDPAMHTSFCMVAGRGEHRRIGTVRVVDVAPTVSEWVGIPPPPHSTGTSRLRELLPATR